MRGKNKKILRQEELVGAEREEAIIGCNLVF